MASPSPSSSPSSPMRWSDKENGRRTLVHRDRGKGKAPEKRKRTMTNGTGPASSRRRTLEPDNDDVDGEVSDQYDPDQPLEERRAVQRGLRDLIKGLADNRDEYLHPDSEGLHETLRKANQLSAGVKQTTEATIDSSLLVQTVHASYKKTARLTSGNIAQGIDTEEFISKCITYMRLGSGIAENDAPELSSTQRQRRNPGRRSMTVTHGNDEDDEDSIGDEGDMLNWEHLGRFGCLPYILRPATPGFLLGPLSVEKKVRKIVKRSAPFRADRLVETRPEVLNAEDIQRNEKNDLTAICAKILKHLKTVQVEAQDLAEEAFNRGDEAEVQRCMHNFGLRDTGGIDLFRFVVNPKSFGQTVENLFYISFLIRDGKISIEFDEAGLPSLVPVTPGDREPGATRHGAQRQQAILSIDFETWHDIIDAFDIKESLIEHRQEQTNQGPGSRGWYS